MKNSIFLFSVLYLIIATYYFFKIRDQRDSLKEKLAVTKTALENCRASKGVRFTDSKLGKDDWEDLIDVSN